ncbi:hypothetical protein [Citrobacter farmeri]|uniref:hypothetical protein n=1 Tax=Citrobacter farmeri TaxID=67824 RepID=UPI0018988297|nr:hypothetical protein [Citrobacter farmeri]EKU0079039.1 hypothetical protein [Citrobacter farmeri]EKU0082704.1 hypothetical protein [Citrobacter farmeri]MDB2170664.1 hypothetical protein [Citrobacter farmeri]MDZ7529607.1 hypothetical protein [Citrobacter farmeri]HCD1998965.1 hypothetical protein [Citrobacter farmeri]
MNKIQILSLAFCLSLTGCKEAEIKGEWTGATNYLNAGLMRSLFLDAKVNINDENISVSESENEGGTTTFLVTIGDKKHSKEWIEATLKKVKQLQYEKNTAINITFTDENYGKDANENELLKLLNKLNMQQKGTISTNIDWSKSEVVVYTRKKSITGQTDLYSQIHPAAYCKLQAMLTNSLPRLEVKSPLPYISFQDIPESLRSSMTEKQLDDYIKDENGLRRYVNIGMKLTGNNYPHSTAFSDKFMNKLTESNGVLAIAPATYTIDPEKINIEYGDIPNVDVEPMLGDMGGELHRKCSEIIKKTTPEIYQKREHSMKYANISRLIINPEWKTGE